jgi:hypothetical protein
MSENAGGHGGRGQILKEIRELEPGEYSRYTSSHKKQQTNDVYSIAAAYRIYDGKDVTWLADVSFIDKPKRIHGEFEVLSGNVLIVAEQMVHERICARIDAGEF